MSCPPMTEQAAAVVAAVAALESERDTLLGLLHQVVRHEHLTNRMGEVLVLLPEDVAAQIKDALT